MSETFIIQYLLPVLCKTLSGMIFFIFGDSIFIFKIQNSVLSCIFNILLKYNPFLKPIKVVDE